MPRIAQSLALRACFITVVILAAGVLAWDYLAFASQCRAGITRFMKESVWPSTHPEYDSFYNANAYTLWHSLDTSAPDVIYFNDSVMGAHDSDERQDTLAQLVAAMSGRSVQGVSAPGLTPVLVKAYAKVLAQALHKPGRVIININPRALTVRDFFDLNYYYGNLLHYLTVLTFEPGVKTYLAWCAARLNGQNFTSFLKAATASGAFPAQEDYFASRREAARQPLAESCAQADLETADLCRLFIDNYMTVIDDQCPMLLVLGDALSILLGAGIAPIVYVTPINMEEARAGRAAVCRAHARQYRRAAHRGAATRG